MVNFMSRIIFHYKESAHMVKGHEASSEGPQGGFAEEGAPWVWKVWGMVRGRRWRVASCPGDAEAREPRGPGLQELRMAGSGNKAWSGKLGGILSKQRHVWILFL